MSTPGNTRRPALEEAIGLQELHGAVNKISEERKNQNSETFRNLQTEGKKLSKAKWTGKNILDVLKEQLGTREKSEEFNNDNNNKIYSKNDFTWKHVKNAEKVAIVVNVDNFTLINKKSEYVNKTEVEEEDNGDNVNNWSLRRNQLETSTTDFNLGSSDFNAKDFAENTPINKSQPNVPAKDENILNSFYDLDQLSFINNSSIKDTIREDEKEENEGSTDDEVIDEVLSQKTAEFFAKQQRDLLLQVTEFGLRRMHELYDTKEKEIYDAGVFLPKGSPGSYLAAFNQQTDELKTLSKYAYAALKASEKLREELANSKLRQEIFNVTEDSTKDFPEISLLDTSLHDDCPLKNNPKCPTWKHLFRTIDGTCNNLRNPWWGAIFQPLKRFLHPHYSNGLDAVRRSVRGGPLPSPRLISNEVHWDKDVVSKSVTHLLMQWGQFIDHDMTSSSQSRGFNGSIPRCCDTPVHLLHPDCLPIEVPPDDRFHSRFGTRCLEFLRSAPSSRVGCGLGPREQVNQVTSYIDGSMIYGNSEREASKLRLFRNGMLKYTRMPQRLPLLPSDRNRGELCRGFNTDFFCFLSGDFRMNEQPGLMAIHVVFLRLHNRLTRQLAHLNPEWSDERLYQETRKIVGAVLQHITYREFLPIVLDEDRLKKIQQVYVLQSYVVEMMNDDILKSEQNEFENQLSREYFSQDIMKIFDIELLKEGYYNDYSDEVSGSAANAFAAAAFRFGHSLVQGKFLKWDDIRKEAIFNVSLHEELLDPGALHRFGAVDNLMMGMCIQESQKRDEHFTVELTNHLFQTPRFPAGLDLAAINIQRGRDHGLPSYNFWRNPCGLRKMKTWDDLLHVMPEETRNNLRSVYRDIDDIDLYVGGLAEFSVRGGLVGSTFSCIIAQHFKNIRRGDRFWYENGGFDSSFTISQLKAIRRITLARILCDNLDLVERIQPFVFLTTDNLRNPKIPCRSGEIPFFDLSPWEESPKGKWNTNLKSSNNYTLPEMPVINSSTQVSNEVPSPME